MPTPTVLLVDDEQDILDALKAGIERGIPDARVITAGEPRAALRALDSERVDIIISDQKMPGMEGIDLLVEARARAPAADRIMMTGHATEKLLERDVNEAHITHFFAKPYKLGEVVAVLRRILARRDAETEQKRVLATVLREALQRREA